MGPSRSHLTTPFFFYIHIFSIERLILKISVKEWKFPQFLHKRPRKLMPAVHSRRLHLARVSGQEWPEIRLGKCNSLHSCRELSILVRNTRRQPGETRDPLTRASRTAKKARHERRGYARGSKARRVFPFTFSLSPCLGFPQRECTAGIRNTNGSAQNALLGSGTTELWERPNLSFLVQCTQLFHIFYESLAKIPSSTRIPSLFTNYAPQRQSRAWEIV